MESYDASIEVLCNTDEGLVGILRVHPEGGDWESRSPYEWVCTVVVRGDEAELLGVLKAPRLGEIRAITQCLKEIGVRSAEYEIKNRRIRRESK